MFLLSPTVKIMANYTTKVIKKGKWNQSGHGSHFVTPDPHDPSFSRPA